MKTGLMRDLLARNAVSVGLDEDENEKSMDTSVSSTAGTRKRKREEEEKNDSQLPPEQVVQKLASQLCIEDEDGRR